MRFNTLIRIAILLTVVTANGCTYLQKEFSGGDFWNYIDKAEKYSLYQQYELAAENYRRAAVEEIEDNKKGFSNSCRARSCLAIVYGKQGKYNQAVDASKNSLLTIKEQKDVNGQINAADIAEHHCSLGDIYQAQGKFDEALRNYEKGTDFAEKFVRQWPKNSHYKILLVDTYMGKYCVQTGDYEKAKKYLQEKLDIYISKVMPGKDIAIAKNELGLAYYYAGDDAEAERLFGGAGGINAGAFVSFTEDLAISLTMLGKIAEHRGENDKALNAWQSALKALHQYSWPESKATKERPAFELRVERADVWNQIGRFQLKQGKIEESIRAHNEAIRFRLESQTQTHPNCADAYKGLADVSAYKNELTSATLQAAKALEIMDASVVPTHPRTAQELMALASIHILSGHPEQAAPLNARLETILQKPLGPWKEDFLATTAFYAGLLKTAGKTSDAERLEQLQIRQKDKR
jgi:tetratricopeptide (TPR) repeat protein